MRVSSQHRYLSGLFSLNTFQRSSFNFSVAGRKSRWPGFDFPVISSEWLILLTSLFFALTSNRLFWSSVLNGRDWAQGKTWLFAAAMFGLLVAIHSLLLGFFVSRRTARPLLAILFLTTAGVVYYMNRYTVFFDTTMARNVLHTDVKEASELLSPSLLAYLLFFGVLPALLVFRIPLKVRTWKRSIAMRAGFLFAVTLLAVGSTMLVFQEFSALMRNHKEVRHLITPSNYLISFTRTLAADTAEAKKPKTQVGTDAKLAAAWSERKKPALLVLVVGETARAANWGLSGYARQTTPKLAAMDDIVNFPHATSCGTNTETSVPCMFSPFGRAHYDEKKIRSHESLLHVLEHAGIKTLWRDNQAGCKGVCDGLEQQRLDDSKHATLCDGERCLDEILLENLDAELAKSKGSLVLVLHQLGNHGPAYHRRYPAAFRQFGPACENADLGKCSQQEIVNSYDNALLYTDYFLEQTIRKLKAQTSHDAAMIYISDHGESLGEKGIFLHGLPYAIAPKEQTEVPMVAWMSEGFSSSFGLNRDCLKKAAAQPVSHDNLFHTVLGVLQVETKVYDKGFDFTAGCR